MTPKEILLKAADLIETNGWCQGAVEKDGKLCAIGALRVAAFGRPEMPETVEDWAVYDKYAAAKDMLLCLLPGTGCIIWWNDASGRTAEEVVGTMKKAAGL